LGRAEHKAYKKELERTGRIRTGYWDQMERRERKKEEKEDLIYQPIR
jgi:hypothetical protein